MKRNILSHSQLENVFGFAGLGIEFSQHFLVSSVLLWFERGRGSRERIEGEDRGRLASLHRFSIELTFSGLTFRIMLELIVSDHGNTTNQRHEPGRGLLFISNSNLTLKMSKTESD